MSIAKNLSEIKARMFAACARVNRDPMTVHLLAVSKLQPVELIEEAYGLGLRDFGENYVQELKEKRERLSHLKDIRWHLIGHLQTNKIKQAISIADFFHALDSEKMLHEAVRRLKDQGSSRPWPIFIEVNVDGEESKAGVNYDAAASLAALVRAEKLLKLEGLMCIPEPKPSLEAMRPAFKKLARLAKDLGSLSLSMGMSEDFEVAIEEGAHWIRVGRKLFGDRPQPR